MKILLSSVFITLALAVTSCAEKQEVKEQYCGLEMSGFEVMDYKAMANKGFDYNDADTALHTTLTAEVNKLFNDEHKIVVAFAAKDNNRIALFIVGPDEKAIIEKISCYLLSSKINGLPANRNLMFYAEDHTTLIAAVKNKAK
jgi:phosphotransferase system HPr-like phosphotransfer protein